MNKVPSEVAIGSDMELFLFDNEKGRVVPCVGILEGTKDTPYTPKGYKKGFAIQEDNVMVEYNVPPATSEMAFKRSITHGRIMVLEELQRRHGTQYGVYTQSHTHSFRAADLMSRQAKVIGCEPDFDAYEGGATRINPPKPGMMRACGGHIHLGGDFKCPDFVAALFAELFIGVRGGIYSTHDDPRNRWYGKPGIFRPKPYGIEYRTPNNQWAMDKYRTELVAVYGLRVANYLTTTSAVELQASFRKVPWAKVRQFMTSNKETAESARLHMSIINEAQKAGVPV